MERLNNVKYISNKKFGTELANGTYGSIHHDLYENNNVVVKVNSNLFLDKKDNGSSDNFNELNALALLNGHPFIVNTYGFVYDEDIKHSQYKNIKPIMTVHEKLHYTIFDIPDLDIKYISKKKLMLELAIAIEFMHMNNIIHFDLSANNVMVGYDNSIRIIDFGSCRHVKKYISSETSISTELYASLDILSRSYNVNESSDIWTFGIILMDIFANSPIVTNSKSDTNMIASMIISHLDDKELKKEMFEKFNSKFNNKLKLVDHKKLSIKAKVFSSEIGLEDMNSFYDLISKILTPKYQDRLLISEIINHEFFADENLKYVHKIRKRFNKPVELKYEFLIPDNRQIRKEIEKFAEIEYEELCKELTTFPNQRTINNHITHFLLMSYDCISIIEKYVSDGLKLEVLICMIYNIVQKLYYYNTSFYYNKSFEEMYYMYYDEKIDIDMDKIKMFEKEIVIDKYMLNMRFYIPFGDSIKQDDMINSTKLIGKIMRAKPGILNLKELEELIIKN